MIQKNTSIFQIKYSIIKKKSYNLEKNYIKLFIINLNFKIYKYIRTNFVIIVIFDLFYY